MNNLQELYKINISIDDVNPKKMYRIIGEPTEKYLSQLHNEFGVKISLFIPANHHGDARLSENKEWINELKSLPYIEFGAHGYYHNTSDQNIWGECEFAEQNSPSQISELVYQIKQEWWQCDLTPKIWKSPGWLTSRNSANILGESFDIAVIHPTHNNNLLWPCRTINVTDYFPPNQFPGMGANLFIFSHIHGRHDNAWNENFFNYCRNLIGQLSNGVKLEHSFIKDM